MLSTGSLSWSRVPLAGSDIVVIVAAATARSLRINTGVVPRLEKEVLAHQQEYGKLATRVDKRLSEQGEKQTQRTMEHHTYFTKLFGNLRTEFVDFDQVK